MSKALNELKKATMASYLAKAGKTIRADTSIAASFDDDYHKHLKTANKHHPNMVTPGFEKDPEKLKSAEAGMKVNAELRDKFKRSAANRIKGIALAGRRLAKEEAIDEGEARLGNKRLERSTKKIDTDKWAKHVKDSEQYMPQSAIDRRNKLLKKDKKFEEVEQVNEVSRSTIAKLATARWNQAQDALKRKNFHEYSIKMKKAIKAADSTTPNVGWSPEDDPKNEEVVLSAQEKYRQIKEAKLRNRKGK